MSLAEIFLVVMVALVVFSPAKLLDLAHQFGKWVGYLQQSKYKLENVVNQQLQQAQLQHNEHKASQADQEYMKQKEEGEGS